jgi:DNA-binding LacI/PurR family transcriptional regulator
MASNERYRAERTASGVLARQTDGLIIAPARGDVSSLREARPRSAINPWSIAASASRFDTIAADSFDAAKRGCQHLLIPRPQTSCWW